MTQGLIGLLAFTVIFSHNPKLIAPISNYGSFEPEIKQNNEIPLAFHVLEFHNRHENEFINNVFKYNILLALNYLCLQNSFFSTIQCMDEQSVIAGASASGYSPVLEEFETSFVLKPNEVFAFHENILPAFNDKAVKTMGSRFLAKEGYRSSGWIFGDGVCHLASLINWTAQDAGLEAIAKVNHNFRSIPDIPEKHSISIRYSDSGNNSKNQNLYIINRFDYRVRFRFRVDENRVELKILKMN